MSNKRPLKAFVRYDGSGRAVSSSLIWRKNKPKVGNWKEVQGYECCNPEPLSACSEVFVPLRLVYSTEECVFTDPSQIYYLRACNGQFQLSSEFEMFVPVPDGYYSNFGDTSVFFIYVENSIIVANTPPCP